MHHLKHSSLLLHSLALETIHNLQGAVPLTPVDTVGQLAAFRAAHSHSGHQVDLGPHRAVEHGQQGGDSLHALVDGDLQPSGVTAARVT